MKLNANLLLSNCKITFYGGIHEIGGNKFLVEDRGTKVFLDFGMQVGKVNQYFGEFVQPFLLFLANNSRYLFLGNMRSISLYTISGFSLCFVTLAYITLEGLFSSKGGLKLPFTPMKSSSCSPLTHVPKLFLF